MHLELRLLQFFVFRTVESRAVFFGIVEVSGFVGDYKGSGRIPYCLSQDIRFMK